MKITLKVWRQKNSSSKGAFSTHEIDEISEDMSFLEMFDLLNQKLIANDAEPVAFDSDCREGICGACSMTINGSAHGPQEGITTCQLHMRKFKDGDVITVEPFRAKSFPIIKDLVVDRSPLDAIIQSGGFIDAPTGAAQDANAIPIGKPLSDLSMDAAQCIGCGACVSACPNSAAQLFTSAKLAHLNLLPQGQAERYDRTAKMVNTMESFFGSCTNHGECEKACPKNISINFIAMMNKDYVKSQFRKVRS